MIYEKPEMECIEIEIVDTLISSQPAGSGFGEGEGGSGSDFGVGTVSF